MSIQTQSLDPSIHRIGVVRSYARKNEIVREDDPANHVYEVVSGTIGLGRLPCKSPVLLLDIQTRSGRTAIQEGNRVASVSFRLTERCSNRPSGQRKLEDQRREVAYFTHAFSEPNERPKDWSDIQWKQT